MRSSRRLLAIASGSVLLASCSNKPPTAIVVAVSTEGSVPRDMDRLEIAVRRGDSQTFETVVSVPNQALLPGTLTLTPDQGESSITVEVRGASHGAPPHVIRRATLGFVEQKQKLLRMTLRYSCYGNSTCVSGESCLGGKCVPDPTPDPSTLPDATDQPPADGCFDESMCFTAASTVPLDVGTCSVALPAGQALGALYAKWPDRHVVLTPDPNEGYTRQGNRAVLADGLCGLAKSGAIAAFFTSAGCAEAALDQIACPVSAMSSQGGSGGAGGTSQGGAAGKTTGGNGGNAGSAVVVGPGGNAGAAGKGGASGSGMGGVAGMGGASGAGGSAAKGGSAGAGGSAIGGAGGAGGVAAGGMAAGGAGAGGVGATGGSSTGGAPTELLVIGTSPSGVQSQPFTEVIMFNEALPSNVVPNGSIQFLSPADLLAETPGQATVDATTPTNADVVVDAAHFIPGLPFTGLVKSGLQALSGHKLANDYPFTVMTGPEATGTPLPFSNVSNSCLLSPVATTHVTSDTSAYFADCNATGSSLYIVRYESGTGITELYDVMQKLPMAHIATPPQHMRAYSAASDGSGGVFVAFMASAQGQTNPALYVTHRSAGTAGAWSTPALVSGTNTLARDLVMLADASGHGNVVWNEIGATSNTIRHAHVNPDGSADAPADLDTISGQPFLSAAAAADGSAIAAWQGDGGALRFSNGAVSSPVWATGSTVPAGPSGGQGALTTAIGMGGIAYVAFDDGTSWETVKFGGAAWSQPYVLAPAGAQYWPQIDVAASGDAVIVMLDNASTLQTWANISGSFLPTTYMSGMNEAAFVLFPDPQGMMMDQLMFRTTSGDIHRATFNGMDSWSVDAAFNVTSKVGTYGYFDGALVAGTPFLVYVEHPSNNETVTLYRN